MLRNLFIIQPVVENAFQHGVRDVTSGGVVSLRYRVLPDSFQVIVADNSGKMDEEHVRMLWERLKSDDAGDSNALRNLYRRLQLYQGGERILTDDKAPVELLGMKTIDGMISGELAYYKQRFEEDGIAGLIG